MKEIPLTKGKVALVDDEDYERLIAMGKWCFNRYPQKTKATYKMDGSRSSVAILMHRVIMNAPDGLYVDHIDGNPLNNQKYNLRLCSHKENMKNQRKSRSNKSGFKGVTWKKQCKRWQVTIDHNYIGVFKDVKDAAKAYNDAAIKLHGEFANLNPI